MRFPFIFLALFVAACDDQTPDHPGRRSQADTDTDIDTGAQRAGDQECGAITVLDSATVTCADPPQTWDGKAVEVYDGVIVFEVGSRVIAVTGGCVAEGR